MEQEKLIEEYLCQHSGSTISSIQANTGLDRKEIIQTCNFMAEEGHLLKSLENGKAIYTLSKDIIPPSSQAKTDHPAKKLDWEHLTFHDPKVYENEEYKVILPDQFQFQEEPGRDFLAVYVNEGDDPYDMGIQILAGMKSSTLIDQLLKQNKPIIDRELQLLSLEIAFTKTKYETNQLLKTITSDYERIHLGNSEGIIQYNDLFPDELYLQLCIDQAFKMFTFKFYGLSLTRRQQKAILETSFQKFEDKHPFPAPDVFDAKKYQNIPGDNFLISMIVTDLEEASISMRLKNDLKFKILNKDLNHKIQTNQLPDFANEEDRIDYLKSLFISSMKKRSQKAQSYVLPLLDLYENVEWEVPDAEIETGWKAIQKFIDEFKSYSVDSDGTSFASYTHIPLETLEVNRVFPHLVKSKPVSDLQTEIEKYQKALAPKKKEYQKKLEAYTLQKKNLEEEKQQAKNGLIRLADSNYENQKSKEMANYKAIMDPLSLKLLDHNDQIAKIDQELPTLGWLKKSRKNYLEKERTRLSQEKDKTNSDLEYMNKSHHEKLAALKKEYENKIQEIETNLEKKYPIPEAPSFDGADLEQKVETLQDASIAMAALKLLNSTKGKMTFNQIKESLHLNEDDEKRLHQILKSADMQCNLTIRDFSSERSYQIDRRYWRPNSLSDLKHGGSIGRYLFNQGGSQSLDKLDSDFRVSKFHFSPDLNMLEVIENLEKKGIIGIQKENGSGENIICTLSPEWICRNLDFKKEIDAKSSISRNPQALKERIYMILDISVEPLTVMQIVNEFHDQGIEISNMKVSALLKQMIEEHKVNRTVYHKTAYFTIA